ncbi:hypothetical protein A0H81_10156 [Grifola frondosa]|uniref:Uncharacterized protein n=1 Tax=Grifola frondosa TaxID=5627 RepID=A0A1C7LYL1_GRIFR|nr:hypothetical protein A0H81_10156 [Grifola frondosa]
MEVDVVVEKEVRVLLDSTITSPPRIQSIGAKPRYQMTSAKNLISADDGARATVVTSGMGCDVEAGCWVGAAEGSEPLDIDKGMGTVT